MAFTHLGQHLLTEQHAEHDQAREHHIEEAGLWVECRLVFDNVDRFIKDGVLVGFARSINVAQLHD